MRFYLIFTIIVFGFNHVAKAQTERYYTENWEGTEILKRRGKAVDDKPHGEWEYFTKQGVLYVKGEWQNGVKEGDWKYYQNNEGLKLKRKVVYKNNQKNGPCVEFSSTGKIKTKGAYEDDKPTGTWQEFYFEGEHQGKLKTEIELKPNITSAILTEYFYNEVDQNNQYLVVDFEDPYYAKIQVVFNANATDYSFVNYELFANAQGGWKGYYKDGKLFCEGEYHDGEKVGTWKFHYNNEQLWGKFTYKDEEYIGEYLTYHKNGTLREKGVYNENGYEIGEWYNYHDNGNLHYKINYKLTPKGNTAAHGINKEFFADGSLKGEYEYGEPNSKGTQFRDLKRIQYSKEGEVLYYFVKGEDGYGKNSDGTYWIKWTFDNNVKTFISYYDNGKEKEIYKFSKNENDEYIVRTGIWKYYNEDGSLQKTETYENGELKE